MNVDPWQDAAQPLTARVEALCRGFGGRFPEYKGRIDEIVDRLDGPLRIAIAGRVNAGKSTLLNALVGERLAPTDLSECTKVVTSYRFGRTRTAVAVLRSGGRHALPFTFDDARLDISLDGIVIDDIERIDVTWPSRRLDGLVLIDTPGLAAVDTDAEARTRLLFADNSDAGGEIDAVIYLMRHLHSTDSDFLDAFLDRSLPYTTPANAIAVLSRADQIGAGSLDSMEIAGRIASRYEADPHISALVQAVVPVSGLLAESSVAITEDDVAALFDLARLDQGTLDGVLLSVDRVSAAELRCGGEGRMAHLLGLFGIRYLISEASSSTNHTASSLASALEVISGIGQLRTHVAERFVARAGILRVRTALGDLHDLHTGLPPSADAALWLGRGLEEVVSSAIELALLRVQHKARVDATFSDDEARELSRLLSDGVAARAADDQDGGGVESVLAAVQRWKVAAADPMASHARREAASIMARAYERLHAVASRGASN